MGAVLLADVLTDEGAEPEQWRLLLVLGVAIVAGAVLVVRGLRPEAVAVVSSERPIRESEEEDGWVRLGLDGSVRGAQSWSAGAYAQRPFSLIYLGLVLLWIVSDVGAWAVMALLAAAAATAGITVAVFGRLNRSPWVRVDGSSLRRGKREVGASDITAASLFFTPFPPSATSRSLTVTLSGEAGFRTTVGLRLRGELVLTDAETASLCLLIERSSIEMPRDRYDPTGRFSQVLYSTHLTKERALALVHDPPGDGESLPIGSGAGRR